MTWKIESVSTGRQMICRHVLAGLPEWFGIPEAVEAYASAADGLPMLVCRTADGSAIGFASMRHHTPFATEIGVMGVERTWHRRGVGRALVEAAAQRAEREGTLFLTAKTVGPSNPDPSYAATRRFYEALGFLPIEEFTTVWDGNPCLLMLRPLAYKSSSQP
ncbi:MAG: N-acetyltransferase family protein [Inquilinaceae bacterium]